jgi:transcriptional regulator with XRE-family HTH domain
MKNITQREIAEYVGKSEVFIHELRKGTKWFSKKSAKYLSKLTNIPFEFLALTNGEELYQALVFAYQQRETIK